MNYQDPWFPLAIGYFNNPKIVEAGFLSSLCHMYSIAMARKLGNDEGVIELDHWSEKRIRRWIGVGREFVTRSVDVEFAMRICVETELIDEIVDANGKVIGVKPHDFDTFAISVARKKAKEKKRLQRLNRVSVDVPLERGQKGTKGDKKGQEGTCPQMSPQIKEIKERNKRKKECPHSGSADVRALSFSEEIRELTAYLIAAIRTAHPKWKMRGTLDAWHRTIDRMLRIDKRDPERARTLIDWSTADEFWSGNIMSADKLRKQWDMLDAQYARNQLQAKKQAQPTFKGQPHVSTPPGKRERPLDARLKILAGNVRDRGPIALESLVGTLRDAHRSDILINPTSILGEWLKQVEAAGRISFDGSLTDVKIIVPWDTQPADALVVPVTVLDDYEPTEDELRLLNTMTMGDVE